MKIKICGLTNGKEAQIAAKLGADALGFNFYPKSKRYVAPATALAILRELPPFVDPVALYVNEPMSQMIEQMLSLGAVRTIQFHGESLPLLPELPLHFIPAFSVRDNTSLSLIDNYLSECRSLDRLPNAVLVDAHVPGEYGGTGQTAPWDLLAGYSCEVPLILAGGLTPENVAKAIRIVRPYGVDVASGVESAPGVKDPEKMRRFIETAQEAL